MPEREQTREQPEDLEEIEEEVTLENPDRTTRREALELELMEQGRSEEGADADLDQAERHLDPDDR